MKQSNDKDKNKLRKLLDSLKDDGGIDQYKQMAYTIGRRELGEKLPTGDKSDEILAMIRSKRYHERAWDIPFPSSARAEVQNLRDEVEDLECALGSVQCEIDDLMDKNSTEAVQKYLNELSEEQADLIKDIKDTYKKLGH